VAYSLLHVIDRVTDSLSVHTTAQHERVLFAAIFRALEMGRYRTTATCLDKLTNMEQVRRRKSSFFIQEIGLRPIDPIHTK
jgi:hypothetical protein